jgi:hypothetical protein
MEAEGPLVKLEGQTEDCSGLTVSMHYELGWLRLTSYGLTITT